MDKKVQSSKFKVQSESPENPGLAWWVLLVTVAGFALLSLLGAAALIIILSYGG